MVAVVAAVAVVALVVHFGNSASATKAAGGWSVVSAPTPTSITVQLNGVSCVNDADCWAVGYDYLPATGVTQALIEQWNGKSWKIVPGPTLPNSGSSVLNGVACISADDCWAVGDSIAAGGNPETLIEQDTGGGWSVVSYSASAPGPVTNASLSAVTCAGSGDCWAVGSVNDGTATGMPWTLVEENAGNGWSTVPSLTPPDGDYLDGVTCIAGGDCWAVGAPPKNELPQGGGASVGAPIEEGTGSVWRIASSPAIPSQVSQLSAVSCVSADLCWAVGSSRGAGGDTDVLIEENTGSGWSIVPSATPRGESDSVLAGVTCLSTGDCWAVGSFEGSSGARTLIEENTGSGWSIVASPNAPGGTGSLLSAVTCLGPGDCWAVGSSTLPPVSKGNVGTINSRVLIERLRRP
jgi:hypothetical protein